MALTIPAVSAQVISTASSAAATLPSGWAQNDLLFAFVASPPAGTAGINDSISLNQSYSLVGTRPRREDGANDLICELWYKVAGSSETAPTVTVGSAISTAAWTVTMFNVRDADTVTPFDGVTPVCTDGPTSLALFTPTGLTTATNNAMVVNCVATVDDNSLGLHTDNQGFTLLAGGADYDTNTGTDHATGIAYKVVAVAGAVTMPTWIENVSPSDPYVSVVVSVRAATAARVVDRVVRPTGGRINSNFY